MRMETIHYYIWAYASPHLECIKTVTPQPRCVDCLDMSSPQASAAHLTSTMGLAAYQKLAHHTPIVANNRHAHAQWHRNRGGTCYAHLFGDKSGPLVLAPSDNNEYMDGSSVRGVHALPKTTVCGRSVHSGTIVVDNIRDQVALIPRPCDQTKKGDIQDKLQPQARSFVNKVDVSKFGYVRSNQAT